MIDTDKYEGHNTDDRIWHQYSEGLTSDYTDGRSRADEADTRLIADAPKLLAEVKQLREMLYIAEQNIPLRIHWDCYVNALIEEGFMEGEEE